MTRTYKISGMTCSGCEQSVKNKLLIIPQITSVELSLQNQSLTIASVSAFPVEKLQEALGGDNSKYKVSNFTSPSPSIKAEKEIQSQSWFSAYKPILLVFFYITLVSLIAQFSRNSFDWTVWMRHFMAGFFLVFSFFKMLDLKNFAKSYAMYDIVAKQIPSWGIIYAFAELALGIAFLTGFQPLFTNFITLIIMSISLVGVLQAVFNKRKIQCACLGTVFELPMSTVTIIEDGLMIVMSLIMVLRYL